MSHPLNPLVIPLETLTPPQTAWETSRPNEYLSKKYQKVYSSSIDKDIVDYRRHPVLMGFIDAYKQHRPVTISPDIIWLLVVQGFTHHVMNNAEKLRSKFVDFSGKKELTIKRQDMTPESATKNDWQGIFAEFIEKITSYTGADITDTLTPNFSTTTPVSLAVGQLSIMCSMKKYFDYRVDICGCGIPSVTVEGTAEDWQKIENKLDGLAKYDLKWWIKVIKPHITKIVETKKGKIDKNFWLMMVRYKNGKGFYNPGHADGWLMSFFPYNIFGETNYLTAIYDVNKIPSEMLSVPFNLVLYLPGQNPDDIKPIQCEFSAGFVGLTQNEKSFCVKPEIGWVIHEKSNKLQDGNEYHLSDEELEDEFSEGSFEEEFGEEEEEDGHYLISIQTKNNE